MNLPVKKIEVVAHNESLANVIGGFQEDGCLEIIPEKREHNGEKRGTTNFVLVR